MDQLVITSGFRIVSGGQTGADRAGLDWAIARGVEHGGWCPRRRTAEDGQIPLRYALTETPSSGYPQRTEWNVRDSDATVVFTISDDLTGGSLLTVKCAAKLKKPCIHISARMHPKYLAQFLSQHSVRTLNVAGQRESNAPDIYGRVFEVLDASLVVRAD